MAVDKCWKPVIMMKSCDNDNGFQQTRNLLPEANVTRVGASHRSLRDILSPGRVAQILESAHQFQIDFSMGHKGKWTDAFSEKSAFLLRVNLRSENVSVPFSPSKPFQQHAVQT